MKRKLLYILLATEAVLLASLRICSESFSGIFSSMMAFPFEQLGAALRALSIAGAWGNALALMLWVAIGLLPIILAARHSKDSTRRWENVVLYITGLCLMLVLYGMINPGVMISAIPLGGAEMLPVLKAMLGGVIWSAVICYLVLQFLRRFKAGSTERLLNYMRLFLYGVCALFVGVIAFVCVGELMRDWKAIQHGADIVLAVVRFFVSALPYAMDIAVTLLGLTLLDAVLEDKQSEIVVIAADRLSKICCISLTLVTVSGFVLNVMQLLLIRNLTDVHVMVEIPLMSLVFVLAALLFSRLIAENKRLAEDNNLFI